MSDRSPDRFDDADVKAILARAIELDMHPTTSVDELRSIAAELGVSMSSLEAALREQRLIAEPDRSFARARVATRLAALGLPLGVVLGTVISTAGIFGHLLASVVTGAGLIATGALIVLHGTTGAMGTLRSFNLRNFALWGGMTAAGLAVIAVVGGAERMLVVGTLVSGARYWIVSSVLGSTALAAMRMMRRPEDAHPDGSAPGDAAAASPGLLVRLRTRLMRWLTPMRRWRAPTGHVTQST